jgi:hypothetical protein
MMGRQRLTTTATIVALSLCVLPTGADASSTLLSGYGGPGEGNQAIIGSTLIGGGKGSSGGGSGGAGQVSAGSSSIEAPAPTVSGAGNSQAKRTPHARKGSGSSASHASEGGASTYTPAAATHASGGSTLGLTGADLLYIVLAVGGLALTAVLTGRLTRRPGGPSEAQ